MQVLSRQRGVSLIEVLVAIVVFSVGVLGLALMQVKGAQFTKEAGSRSNMIVQVRSLVDAMRGNPVAAKGVVAAVNPAAPTASECPYCYNGTAALTSVDCNTAPCDPPTAARRDLYLWTQRLQTVAPSAVGTAPKATVTWNPTMGLYQITATWSGGSMNGTAAADTDNISYTLNYMP